jgi:hypothetical protein
MRWVICSFKPQVNRMKTEGVEAGEAYSKHKSRRRSRRGTRHGVRGLEREASVEDAVGNLPLQTPSQSDEN